MTNINTPKPVAQGKGGFQPPIPFTEKDVPRLREVAKTAGGPVAKATIHTLIAQLKEAMGILESLEEDREIPLLESLKIQETVAHWKKE